MARRDVGAFFAVAQLFAGGFGNADATGGGMLRRSATLPIHLAGGGAEGPTGGGEDISTEGSGRDRQIGADAG